MSVAATRRGGLGGRHCLVCDCDLLTARLVVSRAIVIAVDVDARLVELPASIR